MSTSSGAITDMYATVQIHEKVLAYMGRHSHLPYPLLDVLFRRFMRPAVKMPDRQIECSHIAGRFHGNISSHIDWHIYCRGAYDMAGLYAIEQVVRDRVCTVAWDVGANVGNHSLFLSRIFDRVYSFEPSPGLVSQLEANLTLNNLENVHVLEYGLADHDGTAEYFDGQDGNEGQGSFVGGEGQTPDGEFLIRPGDTVFDEIGEDRLDFVKIDVEGFEVEVLRGLRATLAAKRPVVLFEWIPESRAKISRTELSELFPSGYVLHGLSRSRRVFDRLRSVPVLSRIQFDYEQNYGNVLAIPE